MANKEFIRLLKQCGFNNEQARDYLRIDSHKLKSYREGFAPVPKQIVQMLEDQTARAKLEALEVELKQIREEMKQTSHAIDNVDSAFSEYEQNIGDAESLSKLGESIDELVDIGSKGNE